MWDFESETNPKARKEYQCEAAVWIANDIPDLTAEEQEQWDKASKEGFNEVSVNPPNLFVGSSQRISEMSKDSIDHVCPRTSELAATITQLQADLKAAQSDCNRVEVALKKVSDYVLRVEGERDALQAENAKVNKLYNHELSCGKTMRDLSNKQAEGIGELQAENIKLWHNLRDAMEWNWLDDDAPERFDLDIYHVQTRSAENE